MPEGVTLKLSKDHEAFQEHVRTKAKKILETGMPQKIVHLNKLVEKYVGDLSASNMDTSQIVGPDPKVKRQKKDPDNGGNEWIYPAKVPVNKQLVEYWNVLRKETLDVVEMVTSLKLWIQLNVPKIEDGNNFGVGIQEEIVNELSRAEESAAAILDTAARYHASRAKIVTKMMKYPTTGDYDSTLRELDEKAFVNMKICFMDLRNNYMILFDQLGKNMQKLLKPRGEARATSYMY